jgi:hypothetical protein
MNRSPLIVCVAQLETIQGHYYNANTMIVSVYLQIGYLI